MTTQHAESLNWIHSLLQELESQDVALPMGDYTYAYGLIENVRDNLTDLTWGNCVAYSPSAIRTEIRESLSWKFESPDDKPILEWALNASDDDLNEVASYILSGDHIWDTFATDLMDGLREGFAWSKERTPVKKDYTVDMVVRLYVEAESESEARSTAERLYFAWDPEGHNENRQYANMNVKEGHWFMFDYGQPKDDVWFPYESTNGGSDQSNGGN